MTTTKKDPVLGVVQLTGANDAMNTVIPYGDPLYADNRPSVRVPDDQVLKLSDYVGLNPNMGPMKQLFDDGKTGFIFEELRDAFGDDGPDGINFDEFFFGGLGEGVYVGVAFCQEFGSFTAYVRNAERD